ncbi:hypothetical protein [Gluconacetobacter sacchari]|uniref:Uncharacterized protein n=2 Tax=Gluconacetobacter sacchari TaxID=92759 RepID=A0A7W4NMC9_9PROT|nr:hypothetical protein [Gluconacetobacter sacchari]MBB2160466.1 hypothetical protein [Gluconacetobacter sacchari]
MHIHIGDLVALLYLGVVSWGVISLVHTVQGHPFALAFVKFALLATFGECLRRRIASGSWIADHLVIRAIVWGFFGIWIALALMIMSAGVHAATAATHLPPLFVAFLVSLWINVFSGYGFFMMLSHFMTDRIIEEGFKSPLRYLTSPTFGPWARMVSLCLVFFWTPAHTITFMLPDQWRVLFAAYLSVALGLLLSLAAHAGRRPVG